jgi:hypothetical protein
VRVSTNNATFDNLQKLTYTYDNDGNVKSLLDGVNSNQRQCFDYDWIDRLKVAYTTGNAACGSYSAIGTGPYNHSYSYNALGNLTSYAGNAYTYGDAAHKHAGVPSGPAAFGNSYSYDGAGNQTSHTVGGTTYTFNFDRESRAQRAPAAGNGGTVNVASSMTPRPEVA